MCPRIIGLTLWVLTILSLRGFSGKKRDQLASVRSSEEVIWWILLAICFPVS